MIPFILTCLSLCFSISSPALANTHHTNLPAFTQVHLDSFFLAVEGPGTFVLLHDQTGKLWIHNPNRAQNRYIPASTFKIPNALIALETGVADGPDFTLSRDTTLAPAKPYWPKSWKRDHTLATAFQNSVYWYYQEIARRIGKDRMQRYVEAFEYGNHTLSQTTQPHEAWHFSPCNRNRQRDYGIGDRIGVCLKRKNRDSRSHTDTRARLARGLP
jgi:beta-lactamase class D